MSEPSKPSPAPARRPRLRIGLAIGLVVVVALLLSTRLAAVQDRLIERQARVQLLGTVGNLLDEDALHVIVCGSGSPLPNSERAQACVVVFAGGHGYVFDTGMGSAGNMGQWRLPTQRVENVFLTHFTPTTSGTCTSSASRAGPSAAGGH